MHVKSCECAEQPLDPASSSRAPELEVSVVLRYPEHICYGNYRRVDSMVDFFARKALPKPRMMRGHARCGINAVTRIDVVSASACPESSLGDASTSSAGGRFDGFPRVVSRGVLQPLPIVVPSS